MRRVFRVEHHSYLLVHHMLVANDVSPSLARGGGDITHHELSCNGRRTIGRIALIFCTRGILCTTSGKNDHVKSRSCDVIRGRVSCPYHTHEHSQPRCCSDSGFDSDSDSDSGSSRGCTWCTPQNSVNSQRTYCSLKSVQFLA